MHNHNIHDDMTRSLYTKRTKFQFCHESRYLYFDAVINSKARLLSNLKLFNYHNSGNFLYTFLFEAYHLWDWALSPSSGRIFSIESNRQRHSLSPEPWPSANGPKSVGDGDRIQSPRCWVLNKVQDAGQYPELWYIHYYVPWRRPYITSYFWISGSYSKL
jgi:hypothetical protein